jgi:hypothetical protein
MKILLLDGDLNFLKYFSSRKHTVYITSPLKYHYILFSRFPKKFIYLPYTGYDVQSLNRIPNYGIINDFCRFLFKKFVLNEKVDVILAFSERTIYPLLINKRYNFPLYGLPSINSFILLNDKLQLLRKIKSYAKNFSLPERFNNYNNIEYPCVVRGNIGAASKLFFICKNYKDIKAAEEKIRNANRKPFVERLIKEEGWAVFNLLLDKKSKIKRGLIQGTKIKKNKIKKIIKDIGKFLNKIKYMGFCSPQFIFSNNKYYLTEINPRLSGTYFGLDYGVNFPEAFERLFLYNENINRKVKIKNFDGFFSSMKIYLRETMDFYVVPRYLELHLESRLLKLISQ